MTNDEKLGLAPHPIEVEFFSKQANKTTKLINSGEGFKVEGVHRWYEFEFVGPVYLSELKIASSGYDKWNKFDVEVLHSDQTVHQERITVEDNVISLSLGKLALSFRFRPESRWLTKTEILRVVASGYSLEEFHNFEWSIKDIQSRELILSKKEEKLEELNDLENTKVSNIKQLTTEVGKLTAHRNELTESSALLSEKIKTKQASEKDVQSEIETYQEERRGLRSDITSDEIKLSNLTKKLRLFPSEVAGFVEEGNRNIKTYLLLSLPFIGIFAVVLWSLFSNAIDLTQHWKIEGGVDVWIIFLTRVPFVLVAVALIEACGFVVGRLIFEILKINRQRLEFSKLSIIAKDVVLASSTELEMSDEERFAEETKLKMTLLQEHMKSQSQEEFRYTGSALTTAVIAVANRLAGKKNE